MKYVVCCLLFTISIACSSTKHGTIESFWTDFQQAIKDNNKNAVADLTLFPLPGTQSLAANVSEEGMTRAQFLENFDQIFEKQIKETIAEIKASDLNEYVPPKDAALESLKLPTKTAIYSFTVSYIFDEGTVVQRESAVTFYFLKTKGSIKLAYISVVR